MENLQRAEEAISGAMGKRARELERRNDQIKHTLSLEVGDYVWLRRPATPGRASSLDEKFSGPWKLMAQNGTSGLSFQCQLMGSRVRYTTAHVQNMKPYHRRPSHLQHEGISAGFPPLSMQERAFDAYMVHLLDRRAELNGTWSYLYKKDDHAPQWLSETRLVEQVGVPSWVLDTFHAIYELRHEDNMDASAQRPLPKRDATLRREDALKIFKKGAKVVRVSRTNGKITYVWGVVEDFVRPRWRVRYDDGEWEDLTSSQVKSATLLAEEVRLGMQQSARLRQTTSTPAAAEDMVSNDDAEAPAMELVACPSLPADFGSKHEGVIIRQRFETGWSRGVIKKFIKRSDARGEFTIMAVFPNTSGRKDREKLIKLRAGNYREGITKPVGSWHLLMWMPVTDSSQGPSPNSTPAQAALKRRRL